MHNKTKREKVSPLNMLNVVIRELRRCYIGRGGVKSEKETEKWKAVKRFRFGDVVNSLTRIEHDNDVAENCCRKFLVSDESHRSSLW